MKKIVVGIVAKHRLVDVRRPDLVIRDELKDAIFHNGAIAIGILPPCRAVTLVTPENESEISKNIESLLTEEEKENLITQINMCDGIVLAGGSKSDAYEIWIAKYCHEKDIPLLAICAGQNNMVRAMGGTTKVVNNPEFHSQFNEELVHEVNLAKVSRLNKAIGKNQFQVNSRHKRTIDKTGGLEVVGYDDEGNIEIVEDKNKKYFMGIRFHPESLYLEKEEHNKIFEDFLDSCI
ncbi:MAG: gamma-glutamyl-gamma-aminobutyrate hydrolase family protein [Clostridia bacterium]|nr:gamma-glutamyl-gamma-aminobutyrate hydrolase family protein [Clostridia bacterium]